MSNMQGIKFILPERARFCFNDSGGNLKKIFSSDQLFSALINCLALLYPKESVEKVIREFEDGCFAISSLYYGVDIYKHSGASLEKVDSICFLPKPYATIYSDQLKQEEFGLRKRVKNIAFLSTKVYQSLLPTWNSEEKRFNFDLVHLSTIGGAFAITEEEKNLFDKDAKEKLHDVKLISTQTMQKLQVNRMSNSSDNTYFQDQQEIAPVKVGSNVIKPFMYLLYRGEMTSELLAGFRLMADEGIGGRRSRGLGYFTAAELMEIPLEDNVSGDSFVTLSTVFPLIDEVENLMSYQLSERSGYIYDFGGTTIRKRTVRVVNEGSVFAAPVNGEMKKVTPIDFVYKPKNAILLNGKAFLLAFGGK